MVGCVVNDSQKRACLFCVLERRVQHLLVHGSTSSRQESCANDGEERTSPEASLPLELTTKWDLVLATPKGGRQGSDRKLTAQH